MHPFGLRCLIPILFKANLPPAVRHIPCKYSAVVRNLRIYLLIILRIPDNCIGSIRVVRIVNGCRHTRKSIGFHCLVNNTGRIHDRLNLLGLLHNAFHIRIVTLLLPFPRQPVQFSGKPCNLRSTADTRSVGGSVPQGTQPGSYRCFIGCADNCKD